MEAEGKERDGHIAEVKRANTQPADEHNECRHKTEKSECVADELEDEK